MFLVPSLEFKSPNNIFIWYIGNLWNKFQFLIEAVLRNKKLYSLMVHECSEQ
jgi:hypothetical protein